MRPPSSAVALRAVGSRVLRQSVRHAWTTVTLLGVVTLVGVAATVLMPGALAAAIDAVRDGGDLPRALTRLAAVLAVGAVADALEDVIGAHYGSRLTAGLRRRLLGRALALGVRGQQRFPAGDLLARLTVDAAHPASFLPLLLSSGAALAISAGALVGLALIDLRLAAAFLLGVPLAIALLRRFMAVAGQPFLRYQQLQAAIVTRLLDAHRGVRTIRASGTAAREIGRILEPLPALHDTGRQVWEAQRRVTWQLSLLVPWLLALVLSVGGFALAAGDITAGQLVAASSYVGLAMGSFGVVETLVGLLDCQVGAGRVGEVLDARPAAPPPSAPEAVPAGRGRLELREVSVHRGGRTVLDQVTLSVPPGESVAVVGRSGTGKTVLVSLAGRLLDPDDGEVLLDGVPVERVTPAQLRRAVAYAFERPALLGATVHDMIAYARPEASRAEVVDAARAVAADRFIRLLPEDYDTPLARAPLSGGELQRLGLARAVLTGARVIVLDDATSSLDTATEAKVTEGLERALRGRTSLVVAHRAATAARTSLVAWLEGGRLRALAPHAALWSDPAYRTLFAAGGEPGAGSGDRPDRAVEAAAEP